MKVNIYSRAEAAKLITNGFPKKTAVISFYSPRKDKNARLDYSDVCDRVFCVGIPDIDIEIFKIL